MNKIKELRKQKNWNQTTLAKKLNTTQANISGWEKNKWQPDNGVLIKLSELFNVSIDYILGNTNELTTTTQNAIISPEQAKDIWFSTLSDLDKTLINTFLKLNELQKYKVQVYIYGMISPE